MTIALVGTPLSVGTGANPSAAYGSLSVNDGLLVLVACYGNAAGTVASVALTGESNLTQVALSGPGVASNYFRNAGLSNLALSAWILPAAVAGGAKTVTVTTANGVTQCNAAAWAFNGHDTATPIDQAVGNTTFSTETPTILLGSAGFYIQVRGATPIDPGGFTVAPVLPGNQESDSAGYTLTPSPTSGAQSVALADPHILVYIKAGAGGGGGGGTSNARRILLGAF